MWIYRTTASSSAGSGNPNPALLNQDVDAAKAFQRRGDDGLDLTAAGEVCGHRGDAFGTGCQCFDAIDASRHGDNRGSGCVQHLSEAMPRPLEAPVTIATRPERSNRFAGERTVSIKDSPSKERHSSGAQQYGPARNAPAGGDHGDPRIADLPSPGLPSQLKYGLADETVAMGASGGQLATMGVER